MAELDYYAVAKAIMQNEKENKWMSKGKFNYTEGGRTFVIEYSLDELEGYEEPVYDVESTRFGPGGYYGLDVYIVEASYDEIDKDGNIIDGDYFDSEELSLSYNYEYDDGNNINCIRNYFEN